MGARSLLGLSAVVAILVIVAYGPAWGEAPVLPPPATVADPPVVTQVIRGAGSCSSTACHGRVRPLSTKIQRNEHTTWLTSDQHTEAFEALSSPRSQSIVDKLGRKDSPAYEEPRCLACHTTFLPSKVATEAMAIRRDGVSCESCHGPSDRWIAEHTLPDWAGRGPEVKAQFGMVDTTDLVRRARVCAGCHIGAPAKNGLPVRDVDHDMIAAGHPRLYFEFSAYFANTHHHWRDYAGSDATADFPARAWAVGQLVSAEIALELLRDRAGRAQSAPGQKSPVVWPEFSEYGCFSCHHDLKDEPWRKSRLAGPSSSVPGTLQWGSWPYPLLGHVASAEPGIEALEFMVKLDGVRRLMSRPSPDPADVAWQSLAACWDLDAWLSALSRRDFNAPAVEKLFASIRSSGGSDAASWDAATQRYLALVPLSQALQALAPNRVDENRVKDLNRLRDYLMYRDGYASPKSYDPACVPEIR